MAGGRLAKHLLYAGEPRRDARARRAHRAARARWNGPARAGAAIHPRTPGRQHNDPRDAQALTCRAEHRRQRRPPAASAPAGRIESASMGPVLAALDRANAFTQRAARQHYWLAAALIVSYIV